jgi:hypothetical protein
LLKPNGFFSDFRWIFLSNKSYDTIFYQIKRHYLIMSSGFYNDDIFCWEK